jgi:hypothetical protein
MIKMETMKTSKGKAPGNAKKTTEATKTVKSRKVTTIKSEPSEEEIREKAREIYYERISRGEHGTAESDWHEAKDILSKSR